MEQKELHKRSAKYEIKVETIYTNPRAVEQTEALENRANDLQIKLVVDRMVELLFDK